MFSFIFTSKNVLQMFYAKTSAKMLQNICKTFLDKHQQQNRM